MNLEALKRYIEGQFPQDQQIIESIVELDSENSSAIIYKASSCIVACFCKEEGLVTAAAQDGDDYNLLLAELQKHIDFSEYYVNPPLEEL